MPIRDTKVSTRDLATSRAIRGALAKFSPPRVLEIVHRDPQITVHQFCRQYLAGLDVLCSGGTRRAYAAVYQRIHKARKKLGVFPAKHRP